MWNLIPTAMQSEPPSIDSSADKHLPPGLYIVATPIGNLEDITLRALRVLRGVDMIACEDTRQTRKLLSHFQISVPTISCHAHNERECGKKIVDRLKTGARIALVSDAGMPGISDPGTHVVAEAIAAEIPVVPVPGPSASITALAASGLDTAAFLFAGFPPSRSGPRRQFFENLRAHQGTLIFYEAPHRILDTLQDAANVFGANRRAVLAREITKIHEEFLRGTLKDLESTLAGRDLQRGEMTLLIAGADLDMVAEPKSALSLGEQIAQYGNQGFDESTALKQIARERGVSKSEVYREWQREKGRHR